MTTKLTKKEQAIKEKYERMAPLAAIAQEAVDRAYEMSPNFMQHYIYPVWNRKNEIDRIATFILDVEYFDQKASRK